MSEATMSRLMSKPAHKTSRRKFDYADKKALSQKRNTTQTAEDKADRDDLQWTNSLRPLDPTIGRKNPNRSTKNLMNRTEEIDRKPLGNTESVPPAFYKEDMEKWQNKFKTAREERTQEKARIKAMGYF